MKERAYHCPVCGKIYTSLNDAFNCATKDEEAEVIKEKEAKEKLAKQKESREIIKKKTNELNKLVTEHLKNFPKDTDIYNDLYDIIIEHKTLNLQELIDELFGDIMKGE